MAIATLPLIPSNAEYEFETALNNKNYWFELTWSMYEQCWYMNILESDRTPIVIGAKLVIGTYIGRRSTNELFQRGAFALIDTSGDDRDPGFDDLGTRVELRYYLKDDIVMSFFGS